MSRFSPSAAISEVPTLASLSYPARRQAVTHVQAGRKDLNLKDTYADYKEITLREHVQNWRDRCIELAEEMDSLQPGVHFDPRRFCTQSQQVNGWDINIAFWQGFAIGWIAVKRLGSDKINMELFNACTSLTPEGVLVLGQTSKRSGAFAGFFGEGVKIEINRLKCSDANVSYYTSDTIWKFYYDNNRVLNADIAAHPSFASGTLIIVKNAPASAYKPSDFLFLFPCTQAISSEPNFKDTRNLSGLDILLCDHTRKRIYIQGIFVMVMEESNVEFGMNYTGPCLMSKLGIGRDRDSVDLSALLALIPGVFVANRDVWVLEVLCQVIYKALNVRSASYAFTLSVLKLRCNGSVGLNRMTDDLFKYFLYVSREAANHPNLMPVSEITESLTKELDLFGFTPIKVEDNLLDYLKHSTECPSLSKLWEQNYRSVLGLPEYVFDHVQPDYDVQVEILEFSHQNLVEYAKSIRFHVCQYFEDGAMGEKVRFKNFSGIGKKNIRRFIPIKVPSSQHVSYFIFDIDLLDVSLIHEESRRKYSRFSCAGNCGCVLNTIIEDILNCLGAHLRDKYDQNFRRKFLNTLPTNLQAPPSSKQPQSHPPSTEQAVRQTAVKPIQNSAPQVGSSSADHKRGQTSVVAGNGGVVGVELDDPEEDEFETEGAIAGSEKGSLCNVGESCRGRAERCLAPHRAEALVSDSFCSPVRQKKALKPTYCEGSVGKTYHKVNGAFSNGLEVFVTCNEMLAVLKSNSPALLALQAVIMFLNEFVFAYPLKRLFIVVEDSAVIAFNRGGDLFFNLLAMIPLARQEPQYAIDFWFSTFCHELAHNGRSEHDAKFASTFSNIVSYKLPALRMACSLLFGNPLCLTNWEVCLAGIQHWIINA